MKKLITLKLKYIDKTNKKGYTSYWVTLLEQNNIIYYYISFGKYTKKQHENNLDNHLMQAAMQAKIPTFVYPFNTNKFINLPEDIKRITNVD